MAFKSKWLFVGAGKHGEFRFVLRQVASAALCIFTSSALMSCGFLDGMIKKPSHASLKPTDLVFSGTPSGVTKDTGFTLSVSTATYTSYAYKVGSIATTDCADIIGYTIVPDLSSSNVNVSGVADGGVALCGVGVVINALDLASAVRTTWIKDTVAPLLVLTLTPTINSLNQVSYSLSGTCTDNGQAVSVTVGTVSTSATCGSLSFTSSGLDVSGAGVDGAISVVAAQTDIAGNQGNTSVVINKETVAPTMPGAFTDGGPLYSATMSSHMEWTAASDASGNFSHYEVAIGTSVGGADVRDWTDVGNVLSYQAVGLNLLSPLRYYASVRAVDSAGNVSAVGQGDGWASLGLSKIVDTLDPQPRMHTAEARFGSQVALSEDGLTMVVGAPYDNFDVSGGDYLNAAGAAYVYVYSGGAWQFQQKLVAEGLNARQAGDLFGQMVAISGDTIVLGISSHDYDASGADIKTSAGAAWVFVRSGATWTLQQKIVAEGLNGRNVGDLFGMSVAIDGETLVVGAPRHGYGSDGVSFYIEAGAAFVYTRSGATWSLQQKLVGQGLNGWLPSDHFGESVAISGDTIVAGADFQDYDAAGANASARAGAAYVYTRTGTTWTFQQKLVGEGLNGRYTDDRFGVGVAIHADTIAVAASRQDYDANGANLVSDAGAVYVFTRSGATWSLQQKLVAEGVNSRMASDMFGSVSISGDSIAIGSNNGYDSVGGDFAALAGATFLFTRSGASWTLQKRIVAEGLNSRFGGDRFGGSPSIRGDRLAVGASSHDYDASGAQPVLDSGAAFSFDRSSGVWSPSGKAALEGDLGPRMASNTAQFGSSMAVSEDRQTMVIGAPNDHLDANGGSYASGGSAFVYVRSGTNWVLQQKLVNEGLYGSDAGGRFGTSVGISGDTIVIGANHHMYDEADANALTQAGAAFVYTRSGATWTLQQKLVGQGVNGRLASNYFGGAVAISGDTIVVGATGQGYDESGANNLSAAGAAYVFTRSGATWTQQQKLVGQGVNGRQTGDGFGGSLALIGDTVVIGANGQDYDASGGSSLSSAGAAYVFTRSGATWAQQQKLVGEGLNGRNAGDMFGGRVAIFGDEIVVGATGQDYDESGANNLSAAGAAYVFTRSGATWTQQQKLVGQGVNGRQTGDGFGGSVALSADTLVIGSSGQDYDETGGSFLDGAGAAFVYRRTGAGWEILQKLVGNGANARLSGDGYGGAVCVGIDLIGVGATGQSTDATGANHVPNSGAVFVYHD